MKTTTLVSPGVLLLAGLLVLAGCGQDQDGTTNDGAGTETAAEMETEATAADTGAEQAAAPETSTGGNGTETASTSAEPAASDDSGAADTAASGGESHTVTARSTSFDPMVLKINPGDTVSWTNMSGHNVHFEAGNIPEDAETWQTPIGNDVNRTFDKEGLYLYKCDPHFALGMVGALIVGTPDNVAQVEQNAQGMYKRALAKAMKEIE